VLLLFAAVTVAVCVIAAAWSEHRYLAQFAARAGRPAPAFTMSRFWDNERSPAVAWLCSLVGCFLIVGVANIAMARRYEREHRLVIPCQMTFGQLWSYRWVKVVSALLVSVVVVTGSAAAYFGIYTWHDYVAFRCMMHECQPVWRDLAFRRLYPGQPVEEVIARTQPLETTRRGRFVTLHYHPPGFTGLTIQAVDGRVCSAVAGSCCWTHTFFDHMSAEDERELNPVVEKMAK
jgi:hypothetical protein